MQCLVKRTCKKSHGFLKYSRRLGNFSLLQNAFFFSQMSRERKLTKQTFEFDTIAAQRVFHL